MASPLALIRRARYTWTRRRTCSYASEAATRLDGGRSQRAPSERRTCTAPSDVRGTKRPRPFSCERGGHEAVVGRVADGTWQDSIAHDDPEIGLLLVVLVAAAHRDLYESVEQPRSVFSDGQGFKVGFHLVYRPPPELELLTLTYSAGLRPSPWAATSENFPSTHSGE